MAADLFITWLQTDGQTPFSPCTQTRISVTCFVFMGFFFSFFGTFFLKKWRQHFQISCIHVHLNSVWFVYNYHVFVPDVNVTKPCHSWNVKSVSSAGQEVGMET